jgi:feruloyl esterase
LTVAGTPVGAHCQVTGTMYQRTSTVDAKTYAIGFEMRLPNAWNGRFFYQANGGTDGSIVHGERRHRGGGPLTNALQQGFAVISSDAGHNSSQNPTFGIDPQARLDYGYQAVGKLTPMAKGIDPDRLRQGAGSLVHRRLLERRPPCMVAASRYADQYDGILSGDPGLRLPLAALANMAATRLRDGSRRTAGDPATGYTAPSASWCRAPCTAKCDALDGATDGLIQDTKACQAAFDVSRDVPDLHRRARRHLPRGAAENRYREALFGRDDEHRHEDLFELALGNGRHRQRDTASGISPRRRTSTRAMSRSS